MRRADAKKYNKICICSLVSSIGESKKPSSYKFNNVYLPKLSSIMAVMFAVNYLG